MWVGTGARVDDPLLEAADPQHRAGDRRHVAADRRVLLQRAEDLQDLVAPRQVKAWVGWPPNKQLIASIVFPRWLAGRLAGCAPS
jgi:hypothetical protein